MACKRDIKVLLIDKVAELSKTNSISKVNTMFGTEVIKPSGRIFIPSSLIDTYWNKYNEVKNKPVTPERREISLTPNVKPGVAELFESNQDLANAVYEALGFETNITLETEKGSIYYLNNGKTKRDKKTLTGRIEKFSESDKTVYITEENFKILRENSEGLSDLEWTDNDVTVTNDSGRKTTISISNTPKIGLLPLELVKGVDETESGYREDKRINIKSYSFLPKGVSFHVGHKIVSINKQITPQQKQQAQQLYSQYLDSIFPDSQVKDIVYHGSSIKGLQELKREKDSQGKMYTSRYGITFTDNDLTAMIYAGQISDNPEVQDNLDNGQVYSVILNVKNPEIQDFNNESYGGKFGSAMGTYNNALEKAVKEGKDSFIAKRIADPVQNQTNLVVFEPEQIYILGGKQDIEGFKQFVQNKQSITPRKGISELFAENPQLASIGTQEQYERYLSTIFPNSKVKDIVYHGTEGEKFNVVDFTKNIFKRTAFYVSIFKDEAQLYAGKNGNIIPLLINAKNIQFQRDAFFGNRPETIEELTEQLQNINKAKYALQFIGEEIYVTTFNSLEEANDYAERNSGWEPLEKLVKNQKIEELTNLLNNLKLQGEFDTVLTNNDGNQKSIYIVNKSEQVHILGNNNDIEGFKQFVSSRLGQQGNIFYQNLSESNLQDYVASEKTIRDLAARMSDRIGIPVIFEFDTTKEYKGKLKNNTAIINLAYATLDTPIHEILGHPIIRAIKNKEKFNLAYSDSKIINGKFFINNKEITKDEYFDLHKKFENNNFKISQLYQNLLKELETGKGKEVFDRIKRDYVYKADFKRDNIIKQINDLKFEEKHYIKWGEKEALVSVQERKKVLEEELENYSANKYSLEEQQEEAIVELLGLYTADRLDKVKDGKLISLLKRLLKEMKAFMKSLFNQKEVEIDKLPDNMTLGDLADLLAYSNSKLILPGNEVLYTIGDGLKFKTYAEINNHIKELARQAAKYENVDLSKVEIDNEDFYLKRFLEADKEYAQAREIIDTWKEVNDIQYNPEEAYSRGQEFIHVHNAYGNTDTITWLQNLIPNLEDINKANGVMEMSFLTYFQGKLPKHVTRHLNEKAVIKIIAYPKSKDIAFASKTDNHTSSYSIDSEGLQYFIDLSKISKREQLAVNYTKSIKLRNIDTIEPNIADTIDNVAHHNEYAINIADGNFRIEYGKETPYDIKKLIDNINSILDQKYGKLVKPEIKKENIREEFTYKVQLLDEDGYLKADVKSGFKTLEEAKQWAEENKDNYIKWSGSFNYEKVITKKTGIQPTQTKETLKESIESVKNKTLGIFDNSKYVHPELGFMDGYNNFESDEFKLDTDTFKLLYNVDKKTYNVVKKFPNYWQAVSKSNLEYYSNIKGVQVSKIIEEQKKLLNEKIEKYNKKEYTSQALINTKVAALKQVAKKYPRSLIRSEVVKIKIKNYNEIDISFQKISTNKDIEMKTLPDDIKGEYDIFLDELNDSDVNPIFKGTQGETLVDENNNLCALK